MKSVLSQLSSLTASGTLTNLPPTETTAWATSGNCVEEWFPQMITLHTSCDDTPTRVPIYNGQNKQNDYPIRATQSLARIKSNTASDAQGLLIAM